MRQLTAFSPYGIAAASARLRVFDWVEHLGIDAQVHCYIGAATSRPGVLARHPGSVVQQELQLRRGTRKGLGHVLVHREVSPLSRGNLEGEVLQRAAFGVYDFDDGLQWDTGRGGLARRLVPKSGKALAAAAAADRVIAGNALLAEWASEVARDVVVIPTCVDPDKVAGKSHHEVHDPPRIGWIGSPSTEAHLLAITTALLEIHRRTGARLSLVSAGNAPLGPLGAMTDRIAWDAAGDGIADQVDVAVAPLMDGLWNRGKCGYKILQYAAHALPTVGSPAGTNAELLQQTGAVSATTQDEWVEGIHQLLTGTSDHRAQRGAVAREAIVRKYSFAAWAPAWLAATNLEHADQPW